MKLIQNAWNVACVVSLLGGLTIWSGEAAARPPEQSSSRSEARPALKVYASEPVAADVTRALRDLPPSSRRPLVRRDMHRRIQHAPVRDLSLWQLEPPGPDPLLGLSRISTQLTTPPPLAVFDGISFTGSYPPDPVGDVGPNHYVQAVNVSVAVFDKDGAVLVAPKDLGDLWLGQSAACANGNGDPVVLYDSLADRWFLAQLSGTGNGVCIAVSQTPDPGGQYYAYRFAVPNFPDYLKFGVWPDAYYMSSNENSYTAYAFDRAQILMGQPGTFQRFANETNFLLPSDLDGTTPPPAGAPNYFYTFKDNVDHGGADRLEVFAFHVDWANTANTTFTLVDTIPIAPYTYTVCGFFNFNCIPQQGTNQRLDAISEWPMFRLVYRNFGTHESLVGNFTVDVNNNNQAGIRWFELRRSGAAWTLQQEGTHAPDANSRFVGSIAMDRMGNIALGYSTSSSTMYPSIRYATRAPTDPLGTLQPEVTMQAGGGSQTQNDRWGDYSAMNIDPVDDCTFYYTMEYIPAPGSSWSTKIGKFRMPNCTGKAIGEMCTDASECLSGFCVDGVCCDMACGGDDTTDCQVCSVAAGATADGTCTPRAAGIECRAATDQCDAAEQCDGTGLVCPPDGLVAAGTECRAATDQCDAAEQCDGVAAGCPPDGLLAAGTECRGAADSCDIAEQCDGATATCPADIKVQDGTACDNGGTCMNGVCTPMGGSTSGTGGSTSGTASGSGGAGTGGASTTTGAGGIGSEPTDEGGCACRVPGAGGEHRDGAPAPAALALMALAAADVWRRRQRRA